MKRFLTVCVCVIALLQLVGCASFYVDSATQEVAASSFKKPLSPKPTQVLFQFESKGVANPAATKLLSAQVIEQIKESGLFSEVSENPVPNGALLTLSLNNVPLSDDAFKKGFVTGLTFGMAGSQVSDGYVCTLRYASGPQSPPITESARHAIHTVMGAKAAPTNGTKAESIEAAVRMMTRQVVSTVLNALSQDPEFK